MKQTNTGYGRVVAVILFLGLFCGNYFQYQLSPLAPQLMQELEMTPVQFSSIFSAPMLSAIFLGIIAEFCQISLASKDMFCRSCNQGCRALDQTFCRKLPAYVHCNGTVWFWNYISEY